MERAFQPYQTGANQHDQHSDPPSHDYWSYVIFPLTSQDVDAVAQVHVVSFGDSFLATMGVRFLRHYFRVFLDDTQGCGQICLHRRSREVVGFVCGSENVAHHYRVFLYRRLLPSLPVIIVQVTRHPQLATAVLRRVWRICRLFVASRRPPPERSSSSNPSLPPASLMTIGVHPDHRRQHIGEMLVRSFTSEMALRDVPRVKLGVRKDNVAARQLYERLGWRQVQLDDDSGERDGLMYVREIEAHGSIPGLRLSPRRPRQWP